MKRYRFRLDTVLRVRRVQEEQARAGLQRAQAVVSEAEIHADERRNAYTDASEINARGSVDDILAARAHHERLGEAVVRADAAVDAAHTALDHQNHVWTRSQMRVKSLEQLDDRLRDEHRVEVDRAIEHELDDAVRARRHLISERKGL
jgi:flagellar protein FliJ